MVGVEIHANAFETIAQGLFLTDAAPSLVLAFSLLVVIAHRRHLQPLHGMGGQQPGGRDFAGGAYDAVLVLHQEGGLFILYACIPQRGSR